MNKLRFTISFILLISVLSAKAQINSNIDSSVYKIYPWVDIPVTTVGLITNMFGINMVKNKPSITMDEIASLNPSNINFFDKSALHQNYDFNETAHNLSDYGLNVTVVLPLLFLLDKKMKSDWAKILLLYTEAHAVNINAYLWFSAVNIDRYRPKVYNTDFTISERTKGINKNSFFSGHTSITATSSFFVAKVYSDYHPELGNKKYLLFAAAVIPPAFVGFFRYKSSNHFPSDILTGLAVGSAMGILIPHLHKRKSKNKSTSFYPIVGPYSGFALHYRFK